MIKDTNTARQVLGGLILNPNYLIERDKYPLSTSDFSSNLEKIIFVALTNLVSQGARKIEPIDIANALEQDTTGNAIFIQNNGVEYTQDLIEFVQVDNFEYYYQKLKKLSLLRSYKKQGIDISEFYQEDITADNADEVNRKFESLTVTDICAAIKKKIIKVESAFEQASNVESWNASEEVDAIIADFGKVENFGLPINGRFMNKIINGAETGALTIRSLASGVGKTRLAVADACKLAYPFYYDENIGWVKNGGTSEKVLFIMTEQKPEQILKMVLAYLTGINESKFKGKNLTEEEEQRISQARDIMKHYNTLHLMRIPDPDITQIKLAVREKVLTENIQYVFFDYIFISPAILSEFRGNNLRNDEALLLMATALKDLAVELNVSVFTSTQINAKGDDNKEIRNEAALAGGRSTINKADNGIIGARPTNDEIDIIKDIPSLAQFPTPNIVFDVFKVRSGRWTQVRVWSQFDAGTLRLNDLFITDSRFNVITGIEEDYSLDWSLSEEDSTYLNNLSNPNNDIGKIEEIKEEVIEPTIEEKEVKIEKPKSRFDLSI